MRKDKNAFMSKWVDDMQITMKRMNPDWDDDDLREELFKIANKELKSPEVMLDNNYTGESRSTTLISVFDWVLSRKPIVAGNGTFYKNQHEQMNPISIMLDGMLKERKRLKGIMFTKEDGSDEYNDLDRGQANEKINCNSYYGASGMPASAFYSQWSVPATTLTAQSIISTTQSTFEAFLSDNFKFIDINECFHWMNTILEQDYELDEFINIVSVDKLMDRLKNMFFEYNEVWSDVIYRYISHLSPDEVSKIYYKNNLEIFTIEHPYVLAIYEKIFRNIEIPDYIYSDDEIPEKLRAMYPNKKKYNNNYVNETKFLNPNVIPENVKYEMDLLTDIYIKYVYVPFMQIDRIYRLKNTKRRAVVLVDTDSNMINCEPWVQFCKNSIMKSDYNRDDSDNDIIAVNSITHILSEVVGKILWQYGEHSFIPDDYIGRFTMKNEFLFSKLIIAKKKKRYLSSIKLREGNLYSPERIDIKGLDFMKSQTAEETSSLYNRLVKDRLLTPDTVEVKELINELKEFEDRIYTSIRNGEKTFLPITSTKEARAYAKPYSMQGVRAVYAWNKLYPDNNIELPAKVNILKLNIFSEHDIDKLKYTCPEIHEIIIKDIFNSSIAGIASKGLQVLAIPNNVDIPEWVRDYIDYTTIINNIIGQFSGVLEILDVANIMVGKSIRGVNRKTKKFSNIVHF